MHIIRTGFHLPLAAALAAALLAMGTAAARDAHAAMPRKPKTIIGRLETVFIKEAGIALTAKIDTGTQSSSLNARDIKLFKRGGKDWVRFTIAVKGTPPVTIERPVKRFAVFKENEREQPRRPVVSLGLCIGKLYHRTQVNLADRSNFQYPVLIGRLFLFGRAIVDTAKKFTAKPACKEIAGAK